MNRAPKSSFIDEIYRSSVLPIYAIDQFIPVIHESAYVHPSAEIIGDVIIEANCFIGPCAVLRGDFGRIHVSHHSNVQDNCVLHSFPDKDCFLAPYSHIGHAAVLHGCRIGENALIGMNAVVMDDAVIGKESMVAACAFVKAKFECPPRSMVMGTPAKIARELSEKEINWKMKGTNEYVALTERANNSMRIVKPLTRIQPNRPRFQDSEHQTKS